MTIPRLKRVLPVVLALGLAACSQAQPPPAPPEAAAPPPPPVVRNPIRQILRTRWNFDAGPDQCTAVATAGRESLQVRVRRNAPILLTVALPPDNTPQPGTRLRFAGSAGGWQLVAQPAGSRLLTATLGSDDTALGRVLVLLSGGTLEIGDPDQAIPSLAMPPSDAAGRSWFDCARSGTG